MICRAQLRVWFKIDSYLSMNRILCVFLGGGAGCVTRYLVGRAVTQHFPAANFATGTFIINVTGSFLIGLLMTLIVERFHLSHYWQLTAVVGFLGGYTTFSSFEYDAYLSTRAGHAGMSLLYLASSVVVGFGAVWLGALLAGKR
jgi:fluoride exporter